MKTLFIDLDNTLIFSHRHFITAPKRTAELLNGKVQSYITEKTYSFFSNQQSLLVVPVTTRTLPQYARIENLLKELGCCFSLACNGAVLLRNGIIDPSWTEESLSLSKTERQELPAATRWLSEKCGQSAVHVALDMFVYAGTESPERIAHALKQIVDSQKVDVLYDSRKVYCIPKSLNKGTAVQRFVRKYGISFSIAAGDSDFDVPMLNLGNLAIFPSYLENKVDNKRRIIVEENKCFSDELCVYLGSLLSEEKEDQYGGAVWNTH